MSEEFSFRRRKDSGGAIRRNERRERRRSKVRVDIFREVPERTRRRRTRKIIAFFTEKLIFGVTKNRFCTIPG